MRCEALSIKQEACVSKIQKCICSMKDCFCDIKEISCLAPKKDISLVLKESLQKLLMGLKNFFTEPPAYSHERERNKRKVYEKMMAEIHWKIF